MSDLKVSIVMPVYNRGYLLEKVLYHLTSQEYRNIEYVVVDDGSTDNSREVISKFPMVKYIYRENGGCAAARNTGIFNATGDIILFIDSDVFVPSDIATIHAKYHRLYPDSIIQGQIIRIINVEDAFRRKFSLFDYSRSFFDTANVSVAKKHLEKVGGFDEDFKKGWEDLEIGLRLTKNGLKIKRILKEGYVWHYEGDYSYQAIMDFFEDRAREGRAGVDFYKKCPTFQVKMMTMASPFFIWLADKIFKPEYYKSQKFYDRIKKLIERNKISKAISMVRLAGYCFYFEGVRERLRDKN
ncbi:MAG: glycosyltransferase family 2 protein [Brevinematia bacterium]